MPFILSQFLLYDLYEHKGKILCFSHDFHVQFFALKDFALKKIKILWLR